MSRDIDQFQRLLASMRDDFIAEIPERCDVIEQQLLALEKSPEQSPLFNKLFRNIHSLKGAGGTHGLNIITSLCHQFENLLVDSQTTHKFDEQFTSRALTYLDLLRNIQTISMTAFPDYSLIDTALNNLHQSNDEKFTKALIAESSHSMISLYAKITKEMSMKHSIVNNGLNGLSRVLHEPFDVIIVGHELEELNGVAMIAALKASQSINQNTPAILISSQHSKKKFTDNFYSVIKKDNLLVKNLSITLGKLLNQNVLNDVTH